MSPDLRGHLVFVLFVGSFLAWQTYTVLRRRRRQRAVAAAHRLPRPPRRRLQTVVTAFLAVLVVADVAAERYLTPALGENATTALIVGGLALVMILTTVLPRLRGRDPVVGRAGSLARAGRRADAISLLESALATTTPTASRHAALGLLLSEDDRHADAERAFARAADLDPADPDYPLCRADALCELSRPADALAALDAARAAHPHEAALPAAACLALLDLSRDDEAREHFRQAGELLAAFPDHQLTDDAPSLLELCRSRLTPSTRAFPVHIPLTP